MGPHTLDLTMYISNNMHYLGLQRIYDLIGIPERMYAVRAYVKKVQDEQKEDGNDIGSEQGDDSEDSDAGWLDIGSDSSDDSSDDEPIVPQLGGLMAAVSLENSMENSDNDEDDDLQ